MLLELRAGYAVADHAATGREAIELMRHYEYDVMLLDLNLPDIEGSEVIRRIRGARDSTQADAGTVQAHAKHFLAAPILTRMPGVIDALVADSQQGSTG